MYVYLGITWLAGLMAALFVPENILSTSPVLTLLVDVFSFAFPIKQFSSKSSFHDAAVVYYLITLPSFPFLCRLSVTLLAWLDKDRKIIFNFKTIALSIIGIFFLVPVFPIWWFMFYGQEVRGIHFNSSRFDLGVFGTFMTLHIAVSIAIIFSTINHFLDRKQM